MLLNNFKFIHLNENKINYAEQINNNLILDYQPIHCYIQENLNHFILIDPYSIRIDLIIDPMNARPEDFDL